MSQLNYSLFNSNGEWTPSPAPKGMFIAPDKRGYPHNIFLVFPWNHVVGTHKKHLA